MANLKASITLSENGPLSLDIQGRKFRKGQIYYSSNPSEIHQFKMDPQFAVTITDGKLPPAMSTQPPPPDDEEDDEENVAEAASPEAEHDEKSLSAKNKAALLTIAADEFGLALDSTTRKADLIDQILAAQTAKPNVTES